MNDMDPVSREVDVHPAADDSVLPRPHVRWAAVIWGLLLCAAACTVALVGADDTRREDFVDWILRLTPTTTALGALAAIGALVLLGAVLHLVAKSAGAGRASREPGQAPQ